MMNPRLIRLFILCLALSSHSNNWATEKKHTLLVYGDSLSAAYGMEAEQGWVHLLRLKLDAEEIPFNVVNGSVSGETTTGGLTRLPAMLESHKPELIVLELGGNDGLRGLPINLIYQNLETMIDLAEAAGTRVILVGIQIPPNYGPRYTNPFFENFANLAIKKELSLVPFLIEGVPLNSEFMQSDGIHPRAKAQAIILNNVWPIVEPIINDIVKNQEGSY